MPKILDPSQRRADFVSAIWSVIASEGLSAATLRRVAAEADCTTGALTHYFSDRSALLLEALRTAHFDAGARMLGVAGQITDPMARLKAVLLEALPLDNDRLTEWLVWLAFWGDSPNEPAFNTENASRYKDWRDLVEVLVQPFCADEAETQAEAALIIAMIDGLGLRLALSAREPAALEQGRKDCLSSLKRYLNRFSERTI